MHLKLFWFDTLEARTAIEMDLDRLEKQADRHLKVQQRWMQNPAFRME